MQRYQNAVRPMVAGLMAVLTVLIVAVGSSGVADAQKISQAVAVAIVPFSDQSGRASDLVAAKATDAAALALTDSQEYVVIARTDTAREMTALGISDPSSPAASLSEEQMVRLGQRLRVEKVASGAVEAISVSKNGQCRCRLTIRLLDIATEEYLDGATSDYTTKPIPGWQGDEASVINEALRSAAEEAVRKIQTTRKPRGNVDIVEQTGQILVNLGFHDGIEIGTEFLVVRGIWNAAIEKVVLRKIAVIEAKQVDVAMTRCALKSGLNPRTGDKVYVMYRPTATIQKAAAKARTKNTFMLGLGIAALLGAYSVATGPDNTSAPGSSAWLTQSSPGAEPRIRVNTSVNSIPGNSKTFAWLVYRGDAQGFPAMADDRDYLISVIQGSRLGYFEDFPAAQYGIDADIDFNYTNEDGDQDTGNISATYNHQPLVAGTAYYYKLRRVVDPGRVVFPQSVGAAQAGQRVNVNFTINPTDALSEESKPAGPVTYFYPPNPEQPSDGNTAVDPSADATVFTWSPTVGADVYQIQIYRNQLATGQPVKVSPEITNTTGTGTMSWRITTNLAANTKYYWFVCARKNGEAAPRIVSNSKTGWIFSRAYTFTTSPTPPPPPGTSAVGSGSSASSGGTARPAPAAPWGRRGSGRH
jgi:hypothetical protein